MPSRSHAWGDHFFEAVLRDIRLPDIDGFDLTRYMRGIDATNKTHTDYCNDGLCDEK